MISIINSLHVLGIISFDCNHFFFGSFSFFPFCVAFIKNSAVGKYRSRSGIATAFVWVVIDAVAVLVGPGHGGLQQSWPTILPLHRPNFQKLPLNLFVVIQLFYRSATSIQSNAIAPTLPALLLVWYAVGQPRGAQGEARQPAVVTDHSQKAPAPQPLLQHPRRQQLAMLQHQPARPALPLAEPEVPRAVSDQRPYVEMRPNEIV